LGDRCRSLAGNGFGISEDFNDHIVVGTLRVP
jgi:hypothetical protein